jgi:hypothetical protein
VLLVVLALVVRAHPRRQGWHDRVARSVEVRAGREAEVAGGPAGFVPRTPAPPPPPPSLATSPPPPAQAAPAAAPGAGPSAPPLLPPPPGPVTGPAPVAPVVVAPLPDGGVVPPPPGLVAPVAEAPPAPVPPPPTAPPPPGGWLLRPVDGAPVPVVGAVLVGRDPDVALHDGATPWRVDDPVRTVSKTHALLTADERVLRVEDLDSTHGVLIRRHGDEARLDPRRPTRLLAGDVVVLGAFEIAVEGAV